MKVLREDDQKTAVVGWGRFNPPTIGHNELVNTLADIASKNNADPLLYMSHKYQDKKEKDSRGYFKDPLKYEDKLYFAKKAFGDRVNVLESEAKTIIQVFQDLQARGYKNIIYVGGSDRIGGAGDITKTIEKYNGNPDTKGNIPYKFNHIDFVKAGKDRDEDSDDLVTSASASLARKYAIDGDFESFKEIVPLSDSDAEEMYDLVRAELGVTEISESLNEGYKSSVRNYIKGIYNRYVTKFSPQLRIMNSNHADEIARLQLNTDQSDADDKESLILDQIKIHEDNIVEDLPIISDDNKFQLVGIDDMGYGSFVGQSGVDLSGTFKEKKILFTYKYRDNTSIDFSEVEPPEQATYYICVNTGDRKTLVVNKILNFPVKDVEYIHLYEKVNDRVPYSSLFKEVLYKSAEEHAVSSLSNLDSLNNLAFSLDLGTDLYDKISKTGQQDSFTVDFSEGFGAVALANSITKLYKSTTRISIPDKSNESLYDYILTNDNTSKIIVSSKYKKGGKPSCKGMIDPIIEKFGSGNVPDGYQQGYLLAKWLNNNVVKVSAHQGFINLSHLLIDLVYDNNSSMSTIFNIDIDIKESIKKILKTTLTEDNVKDYGKSCCDISGNRFNFRNITYQRAINTNRMKEYLDSFKVKYLSMIMISIMNKNLDVIKQLNYLLERSIDKFIQVHIDYDGNGRFSFKCKSLEEDDKGNQPHTFNFLMNTGMDKNFKFTNERLAIQFI